jgi:hypothetical protein
MGWSEGEEGDEMEIEKTEVWMICMELRVVEFGS